MVYNLNSYYATASYTIYTIYLKVTKKLERDVMAMGENGPNKAKELSAKLTKMLKFIPLKIEGRLYVPKELVVQGKVPTATSILDGFEEDELEGEEEGEGELESDFPFPNKMSWNLASIC